MNLATFLNVKSQEAEAEGLEPNAIRFLVFEHLGLDLSKYVLIKDESLSEEVYNKLNNLTQLFIKDHKPVQYILGYTYFLGTKFYVGEGCLIPRFDSECVVLKALDLIKNNKSKNILDMCCGSGIMGLTIKKTYPLTQVTLCDISQEALYYTQKNKESLNLDVDIVNSDLFQNIQASYDLIISNPPYIAYNDSIDRLVKEHEPALALYAEDDGLYFYKKIIDAIPQYLNSSGYLVLEIDPRREQGIKEYLKGRYDYEIDNDNGGRARVCLIKNH